MTRGLGEPDVYLGVLSIWVHGYQYPDATDEWDGNWLRVTARCTAHGATVAVSGAILDTVSFQTFQRELSALHKTLEGKAELGSAEPNLSVAVQAVGHSGQVEAVIEITPEHLHQAHRFSVELAQSYLLGAILGCQGVLARYPIRGQRGGGA
jgi:hypothetical protein